LREALQACDLGLQVPRLCANVSYSLRVIQQSKSSDAKIEMPAAQKNVLPDGSISIHMKKENAIFTRLSIAQEPCISP
jgi:hypothetical protein